MSHSMFEYVGFVWTTQKEIDTDEIWNAIEGALAEPGLREKVFTYIGDIDGVDENIELMEGLWIVRGNYPPISEMLSAFFGFFERDFRDFDFQLGMYDSFLDLRDKSSVRLGTEKYIHDLDALKARADLVEIPVGRIQTRLRAERATCGVGKCLLAAHQHPRQ